MLLLLNDDCLEHICKQLSLVDQVALKSVCQRMQCIVQSVWRLQCFEVELNSIPSNSLEGEDFRDFMCTISDYVVQLKFQRLEAEDLHLLEDKQFPKVTKLDLENLRYRGEETNDEDTLLIQRLFPSVQQLTLYSYITGQYIDRMTHLTELDLSCCEFLDTAYFKDIFTKLRLRSFGMLYYGYNTVLDERIAEITKCSTLEELKIDDHHLLLIIDQLLKMPRIQKITCYTRDYDVYLIGVIADKRGADVSGFAFSDVLWSKDKIIEHLLKMKNITKLMIVDDDFSDGQMQNLALNLNLLQEVGLINCGISNHADILCFVQNCQQLVNLNVSGNTKIGNDFVQKVLDLVKKQYQRRAPLELQHFKTNIEEAIFKDLLPSSMLKLNGVGRLNDLLGARTFQCIFTPNST